MKTNGYKYLKMSKHYIYMTKETKKHPHSGIRQRSMLVNSML